MKLFECLTDDFHSAGYAHPPLDVPQRRICLSVAPDMSVALDMPFPPLGVPADLQSAVKK